MHNINLHWKDTRNCCSDRRMPYINIQMECKVDEQDTEIKKIKEEQCLLTYGILACLKGLKEQGCNGTVSEAIDKMEKRLNKVAHDQGE